MISPIIFFFFKKTFSYSKYLFLLSPLLSNGKIIQTGEIKKGTDPAFKILPYIRVIPELSLSSINGPGTGRKSRDLNVVKTPQKYSF